MGFSSPPDPKQFQTFVWKIVSKISPGKVTTYCQIAGMIPPPGNLNLKEYDAFAARWVGMAMAHCPDDLPWQRVINSQGKISARPGANRQRELLEEEGILFDDKGRINLEIYGWDGPDEEWCAEHSLLKSRSLSRQRKLF